MSVIENFLSKQKSRKVAVAMALVGIVTPIGGLHKFYLGQPFWGVCYLLLWFTPIPRVASAIEAIWYLAQDVEEFNSRFNESEDFEQTPLSSSRVRARNTPKIDCDHVGAVADALRQLDQLRTEGLVSEYEFEQKRRQLLDHIS